METILFLFLKFMYYSFIGYLIEIIFAFIKDHKFINRGFLIGPYCSIYGVAGLVLSTFNPNMNVVVLFLLSMFCCFIIEGSTGFILDKIFKMRWWDYSDVPLNIHGYVCLKFMLLFGLFSLIGVYLLNPIFSSIYNYFNDTIKVIVAILLALIYVVDLIVSTILISKIKRVIEPKNRNNTTLIINTKKKMLLDFLR